MKNLHRFPSLIFYFLFSLSSLNAQNIEIAFDNSLENINKHVQNNLSQPVIIEFESITPVVNNITWNNIRIGGTDHTLNEAKNIEIQGQDWRFVPNATSLEIIVPAITLATTVPKLEFQLELSIDASNGPSSITAKVVELNFIVRRPYDLIFVLDRSGSMECEPLQHTWPGCITNSPNRRWDVLIESLDLFTDKITEPLENLDSDSMGVVYFSGTDMAPSFTSTNSLSSIEDFNNNIVGDMTSSPRQNPVTPILGRDGTSYGRGLEVAINTLLNGSANPNRRQAVVLMTDGQNNRHPIYDGAGGNNRFVDNIGTAVLDLNDSNISPINIYTIGISNFPVPALAEQLTAISTEHRDFTNDINGLSNSVMNDFLRDFSPNYIGFVDEVLDSTNTATFVCNRKVSKLYLEAHFNKPYAKDFRYVITKNGVPVDDTLSQIKFKDGHYYATFTIDSKNLYKLGGSEGEWTITSIYSPLVQVLNFNHLMTVKGQTTRIETSRTNQPRIRLSATADDHAIDYDCFTNSDLRVGDKMELGTDFFQNNIPLTDALVTATIIKPGADLADALARAEGPKELSTEPEIDGLCGEQRLGYLQKNNPEILEKVYNVKKKTIELKHTGNGKYRGDYDELDVSGVYKIIYSAKTKSNELGPIERMMEKSVNVLFKEAIIENETREIVNTRERKSIIFRPVYSVGNSTRYVGPGMGFGINASGNNIQNSRVIDRCDGTYEIEFNSSEENPNMKVTLFEDILYGGKFKDFGKPSKKWGLAARGGLTFPFEELDTLYDQSFYGELGLSYNINSILGIEAVAGYYNFEPDYSIIGATLYAKGRIRFTSAGSAVIVGVGGGYYKPKDADATTGGSVRGSIEKNFGSSITGFLEGSYFVLSDPNYKFGTLGIGARINF